MAFHPSAQDPTPRRVPLHTKILIGLTTGTGAGLLASGLMRESRAIDWVVESVAQPIGQIFLRMLLMVVVPLVFTTLVLGVAGLGDIKRLGRIGMKTLGFFIATTLVAAGFGLLVVNTIRPGRAISPDLRVTLVETFAPQASEAVAAAGQGLGMSTLVDIVPRNPIQAAADGDLLALIFFTLVFAVALTQVPDRMAAPLLSVLEGIAHAVMAIVGFAMRLAPLGVGALTFAVTARFGLEILAPLGWYFGAVLLGLAVYQFGFLGLLVSVLGGMRPMPFFRHARLPMLTAFSTASSSATLPTTVRAAERRMGVPREVSGFVLPLGATLHMNGTAFFEAITIVFLAQAFGVHLTVAMQGMIVVMAVLTAISAAGIPSGSIPLIVVILVAVGVPGEAIALILGVEPLLGMARTSTNVTGDLVASLVITRSEGLELRPSTDVG